MINADRNTPMPGKHKKKAFTPQEEALLVDGLRAWGRGRSTDPQVTRLQTSFYELLRPRLETVVRILIKGMDDLRPVAMQEAWIAILRSAASFDPSKGTVLQWAYTITERCALNQWRKVKPDDAYGGRSPSPEDAETEPDHAGHPALAQPLPGPLKVFTLGGIRKALIACFARLQSHGRLPYRHVVELALLSELSARDIARRLGEIDPAWVGWTEDQTRKQIARGIQKIRECLEFKGIEPAMLGDNHHG